MWVEMKKCFDRTQFKVIFLILLMVSLLSFVSEVMWVKSTGFLSIQRAGFEKTTVYGVNQTIFIVAELLPFISGYVFADAFLEEKKIGMIPYAATRTDLKTFLRKRAVVVFLMTTFCVSVPLLVNIALCRAVFPTVSFENIYGLPQYAVLDNYFHAVMYEPIRLLNPWVYNLIFALQSGVIVGIFGLIMYGIFFFVEENSFKVVVLFNGVYLLYDYIMDKLHFVNWRIRNYVVPFGASRVSNMFILFGGFFLIAVILIHVGIVKAGNDIGVCE